MKPHELSIEVGNAREDGEYILYGFGACRDDDYRFGEKKYHRSANVLSAVRLPLVPGQENIITWKVKAPEKQAVQFSIKGKLVHRAELPEPGEWTEISFNLTPEAGEKFTEIVIKCENFIILSRTEYCLFLAKIRVTTQGHKGFEIPERKQPSAAERIYFGDIHIHSHYSHCGGDRNGSPEENLDYSRDIRKYDFAAITDHAEHLVPDRTWKPLCETLDKYNEEGQFVTIPAYEWTSDLYGHKNVYLKKPEEEIFHCMHPLSSSPSKLWRSLEEKKQEAITIPHHPLRAEFPVRWDEHHPGFQVATEMCSMWGCSEYYANPIQLEAYSDTGCSIQDALTKGLQLGFVGGSDGHTHEPGSGGITGVCTQDLTRASIFEAIRQRHCYATTGAKIKLYFIMNNMLFMGDSIQVNQYQFEALYPLLFHIAVEGTAPIEKIELLECNQTVRVYHSGPAVGTLRSSFWSSSDFLKVDRRAGERMTLEMIIPLWERHYKSWTPRDTFATDPRVPNHSKFYYVRVTQRDGHRAWSSPIWIDCKAGECAAEPV